MLSIYNLKPKFQQLLNPVLVFLHSKGITANQITICAIVLSFIIGLLFWNADRSKLLFLALPIGLFVRMALNALDGMMARTYHQQTKLGDVLNELGDVVSDLFIFFPLLKYEQTNLYLVAVFLTLATINEFAGILGKIIADERRYEGPMGKSDRAFAVGLYGLLSFLSINIQPISTYLFVPIIILLIISTLTRISKSLKQNG